MGRVLWHTAGEITHDRMHEHTHTRTHARTHARMHACTHTHISNTPQMGSHGDYGIVIFLQMIYDFDRLKKYLTIAFYMKLEVTKKELMSSFPYSCLFLFSLSFTYATLRLLGVKLYLLVNSVIILRSVVTINYLGG